MLAIRRRLFIAVLALVANSSYLSAQQSAAKVVEPLSRIAFGSCAKQDKPQPIWDAVIETQPQLFLFLGDNIYGDTQDMKVLKERWDLLGAQPGYQKLKETCRVLAT